MNNAIAAGTPLVLRWCSAGTPLVARKKRVFETQFSGTPSVLRRCSAGTPSLAVQKSERTTYHSDRYDFKTNTHPHTLTRLTIETVANLFFSFKANESDRLP